VKNPDKMTKDMNTKIAYTLTKQRLAVEGKWPTYYLTESESEMDGLILLHFDSPTSILI